MVLEIHGISRAQEYEQYHCSICGFAIVNPICPSCLLNQFNSWSIQYPHLKKRLVPIIEHFTSCIQEFGVNAIPCIKCKKAQTVCPDCFVDYIYGQLKRLETNSKIFDEFNEIFDYSLEVPSPHNAKWKKTPDITY
jgi:hypothetical protein